METVSRRRTDNTMAKIKRNKTNNAQQNIPKLKIEPTKAGGHCNEKWQC